MALRKRKEFKYTLQSKIIKQHVNDRLLSWTSSNGDMKKICDMDRNHIKNALAKIERGELDSRKAIVPKLKTELIYREIYNNNEKNKSHERSKLGLK